MFIEDEVETESEIMNDDYEIESRLATFIAIGLGVISWGMLLYLPFQTSVA